MGEGGRVCPCGDGSCQSCRNAKVMDEDRRECPCGDGSCQSCRRIIRSPACIFSQRQTLQPSPTAAVLPPELWQQVWTGLDQGFHGGSGQSPEIHMEGKCKCGKLKFRVDGNLAGAFLCHCHMCRRYFSQGCPAHILWVRPENAVTITEGKEHHNTWTMNNLSHNLRGEATIHFASCCGTSINVNFSDPNGTFTLMWPYNFNYEEFGDLKTQRGAKARHGYLEIFRPRFHAHYENRSHDHEDTLPKLADIWLEGMDLMNNAGDIIGKVKYPMQGFETGWANSPISGNLEPKSKL